MLMQLTHLFLKQVTPYYSWRQNIFVTLCGFFYEN